MPRKIILIPVILLAFVGIVFASMSLFPDTASFPRFPGGHGTMSGVLSMFRSDGTAQNTNMLSGVTASGYLQNNDCSGNVTDKVWVGVDAAGKGICGNLSGLLAIAHFSEIYGTVTVFRSGAPITATRAMNLYEGDIIESDSTGTGTIAFEEDASLIRFFVDTSLELRYGVLGGNTVAEAILSDGSLWGRILTSTGVNIGGGGVVTGVRGTSVYLTKVGSQFTLNLVNSTRTDNEVKKLGTTTTTLANGIKVFDSTDLSATPLGGGTLTTLRDIGSGTTVIYDDGALNVKNTVKDPGSLLSSDQWIRDNTIADVEYMSNLLSGSTDANIKKRLNDELDTTVSSGNLLVAQELIKGYKLDKSEDIINAAKLLDDENQEDNKEDLTEVNENKYPRINCKKQGMTYFRIPGKCLGSWETLAVTNFPTPSSIDSTGAPDLDLHGKKAKWNFTASGTSTNTIITSGQYLEYSGSLSELNGKTIRIEYKKPTGLNIVNTWSAKNMFFTKNSVNYDRVLYTAEGKWKITGDMIENLQQGDISGGGGYYYYVSFKIKSTSNIDTFIIGNNNDYNYALIGVTITKVSIQ